MNRSLLISVRFHEGRYHGERRPGRGEWPPTPARLYQALVASAGHGEGLTEGNLEALTWLEALKPPLVAAPPAGPGQQYANFVPNNDADRVVGGAKSANKIRTRKTMRPHVFDARIPVSFAWVLKGESDEERARSICRIAEGLYQLGRGVDMAWAWGEIVDVDDVERRLGQYGRVVRRPGKRGAGASVAAPRVGSLHSLRERYQGGQRRFGTNTAARKTVQTFSRPPPPRFQMVPYDVPPRRFLFDLRAPTRGEAFAPWPVRHVTDLVAGLRDKAADRLRDEFHVKVEEIDRVLIGRDATDGDKATRVRIVPLPSIGHVHADHAIRRVLIEVPPNCPIYADDVALSFSGLSQFDQATGEAEWNLVESDERRFLDHYGIGNEDAGDSRTWRTVTPVALPEVRPRAQNTSNRLVRETKAAFAVNQALRHASVSEPLEYVRVQREPFEVNGVRAGEFIVPERFTAGDLHHVELGFAQAPTAPLVVGNGRYLGLGLMAPAFMPYSVFAFNLISEHRVMPEDRPVILRHFRRALMAIDRDEAGQVSRLFSGHEEDGRADRAGNHAHVFLAVDAGLDDGGAIKRLIVAAPWAVDRRAKPRPNEQRLFESVVRRLGDLRAGRLGRFRRLVAAPLDDGDPLLGFATTWIGQTPYVATRNLKKHDDPIAFVKADVTAECVRRGLPKPAEVDLWDVHAGSRGGKPTAGLKLHFAVAVRGPLLLGRDSHVGGGLFHAMPTRAQYD